MQRIDLEEIQAKIAASQAASAPTSHASSRPARQLIALLWQLMGSMYGHKWSSAFGEDVDPDRIWEATLTGITEHEMRYGLRQCVEQGLDWPPSAPEFRKLCRGETDVSWEHKRIAAADREFNERRLLEDAHKRERDEAEAFAAMAGIRQLLGMRS